MLPLPSTSYLLSAAILLYVSFDFWYIGIILLGLASLLFEGIFRLPHLSGWLKVLRLLFGRWCVMSTRVLICLYILLRLLLTLQLYLEKFTALLLERIAVRQIFLIGVMGLGLLEWQKIYQFCFVRWLRSPNRESAVQRTPLPAKLSPSKIRYSPDLR